MFQDGVQSVDVEIYFADKIPHETMGFYIEIEEVRGCYLPGPGPCDLSASTSFKLHPPLDIPDGCGYVEFCRATYTVQPLQQKQRVRLRRRGSVGRKKRVEIFTRDLTG